MNVIPVINCPDFAGVEKRIETAKTFLPPGDFVHLDITDGVFTDHKTWNDPLAWASLKSLLSLEVHLMVEHPEEYADNWLAAGARRLIVHAETLTSQSLYEIHSAAERYRADVMLSSKPDSTVEELAPYVSAFSTIKWNMFQVLAVNPGPAGQKFMPFVTEKIQFLREEAPDAIIEIDGGMDPETVRLVKIAGADTVVSSSYIFDGPNPKKAYEELRAI